MPPKISILAAVTVPRGGDTMWCNQYEAYDRLSPAMQRMIQGLRVKFVGLRLARMMGTDDKELPTAIHPLVQDPPRDRPQGTLRRSSRNSAADRGHDEGGEPAIA